MIPHTLLYSAPDHSAVTGQKNIGEEEWFWRVTVGGHATIG